MTIVSTSANLRSNAVILHPGHRDAFSTQGSEVTCHFFGPQVVWMVRQKGRFDRRVAHQGRVGALAGQELLGRADPIPGVAMW
jgi:hypothetical protein